MKVRLITFSDSGLCYPYNTERISKLNEVMSLEIFKIALLGLEHWYGIGKTS